MAVKERLRDSGVPGVDWAVCGRKFDRDAVVRATLGWKVGESAPFRRRGGGFAGERARGVVLALVPAELLL